MIASLNFLPEYKQEELKLITDLIVEKMKPAKLLLFGSYARNTWAEEEKVEEGIRLIFKSDYDILVITSEELGNTTSTRWRKTKQKLKKLELSTTVTAIHHSAEFINKELKAGSYFFTDVIREGIVLYDSGEVTLATPGKVNPDAVLKRAKEEYKQWMGSAEEFLMLYNFSYKEGLYNKAAFLLHQTTESLYSAVALVFTHYKGKNHDLDELSKIAIVINKEFRTVFLKDTKEQIDRYELLKKAYIDARYKKGYAITKEDLEYLGERIEVLKELVKRVCEERLN
ncbi:MAG: HEPN domain-containing protein [Sporocytophaga sp.]|uniref:HEPN domain-containing protein n=1 Tax=Sporocytophaga sp. TaxID=2231183 RepID=UPI001B0F749E|nr:HEPN domain-containing protein [Sporocytophaga sp.]MBO9703657.1 HEPN domain-containing protein [Sporocytophaga sp.]